MVIPVRYYVCRRQAGNVVMIVYLSLSSCSTNTMALSG